ncbi:MAG: divergent PAP2 family protein [Candidatus Omnitrophica bacterium]|nr:divergent PAP2 family protein [Candidatus Omnitrophota bacterium]
MSSLIRTLLENKILIVTFFGWFIAQTIKVLFGVIREKRFDFRWFIGTGGMPSSHASGVTALATTTGLNLGVNSPLFAIAVVFAIVTMFDAQGVRRSTGQQAEILNKIMDDIYWRGKVEEKRLIELIGHTPIQVIIGAIIGLFVALALQ